MIVIEKGLAHAHKNDIGYACIFRELFDVLLYRENLANNFSCSEVTVSPNRRGETEFTAYCATGLARDTEGVGAATGCYFRNIDRFECQSIDTDKSILPGAIS